MASLTTVPVRPIEEILAETSQREEALDVNFVGTRRVMCEGSGGALGHPRVYYEISDKGYTECMYCDRIFVFDPSRDGETITG